jgi:hypothetical protein
MELKFDYTEGNHFKWGWGVDPYEDHVSNQDEWYNDPDPSRTFKLQLGHTTREVKSFREECIHAASLIANKATKPIIVGLSGGSDSQMVCLSLMEAKVPFKVVIVHMFDVANELINEHDIKTAYEFCRRYGIESIQFTINLDAYYRGLAQRYAGKYGFTNLATLVQCATMDFVGQDFCYIMGGGDPMMQPISPDYVSKRLPRMANGATVPVWIQTPQPIMRHMMEQGYEGTSKYFLYTPELTVSYLTDDVCQRFYAVQEQIYEVFCNNIKHPYRWWSLFQQFYKPMMTVKNWPEIIQARKYTGFEEIYDDVKTRKGIYYKMIQKAAQGSSDSQAVVLTIPELVSYLTTPHENALIAYQTNTGAQVKAIPSRIGRS